MIDHFSTNGLSVIAIDEKEHRVAGAYAVADSSFKPEGHSHDNNLAPMFSFCKDVYI